MVAACGRGIPATLATTTCFNETAESFVMLDPCVPQTSCMVVACLEGVLAKFANNDIL